MPWTNILFSYPQDLEEFFEVFDMLEITLEELPDYVIQNNLKPVSDIEIRQMKRTRHFLQMMK